MEGPSLHLAATRLRPFKGQRILSVIGNTTIDKQRLKNEVIRDVFAWGKHLVLQCNDFALRVHFLMFGSYEAEVDGIAVHGDYRRTKEPRLALVLSNGELRLFACSVKFIEGRRVRASYDHSVDVLSRAWDPEAALLHLQSNLNEEIADVLLDQGAFAGVGNIIKNEVLSLEKLHPRSLVKHIPVPRRRSLIRTTREFSKRFLRWRRANVLIKNLRIHRKNTCPGCGGLVTHLKTGKRSRMSHFCEVCQPLRRINR